MFQHFVFVGGVNISNLSGQQESDSRHSVQHIRVSGGGAGGEERQHQLWQKWYHSATPAGPWQQLWAQQGKVKDRIYQDSVWDQ